MNVVKFHNMQSKFAKDGSGNNRCSCQRLLDRYCLEKAEFHFTMGLQEKFWEDFFLEPEERETCDFVITAVVNRYTDSDLADMEMRSRHTDWDKAQYCGRYDEEFAEVLESCAEKINDDGITVSCTFDFSFTNSQCFPLVSPHSLATTIVDVINGCSLDLGLKKRIFKPDIQEAFDFLFGKTFTRLLHYYKQKGLNEAKADNEKNFQRGYARGYDAGKKTVKETTK